MLFVCITIMIFSMCFGSSNALDLTMSEIKPGAYEYTSDPLADPATGVAWYQVPQLQTVDDMLSTNGLLRQNEQRMDQVRNKIFARGNTRSKRQRGRPRNGITRMLGSGGNLRNKQICNAQEPVDEPTIVQSRTDAAQRVEEITTRNKLIIKHKDHEKLPILYQSAALASRKKYEAIGQQKDAQAFFKEAITMAQQSQDHNHAENLKYAAKRYAKAWGKLHAQFLGIDSKNRAKEGPFAPPVRASDSPYHLSIQPHELDFDLPKHNEVLEITVADRLQPMAEQGRQYHNENQNWRKNRCSYPENQILDCAAAIVSGNNNELGKNRRPSHGRRSSLVLVVEKRDTTFDAGAGSDRHPDMAELSRSRTEILARGLTKSKPEDAARDSRPQSRFNRFNSRPSPPRAAAETDRPTSQDEKSTSPKEAYFPNDPTKYGSFLQKETEKFKNLRIAQKSMLKQKTSQTLNVLRGHAGLRSLRHNQRVGEIKDIHNAIRMAIADHYKGGNHDEAEKLKYMLKQFGSAWGQHHGLLMGIDKKGKEEVHQYLDKVFGDVNKRIVLAPEPPYKAQQYRNPKSVLRPTPDQKRNRLRQKRQRLDDQRVASRVSMSKLPTINEDAKRTDLESSEARSPREP